MGGLRKLKRKGADRYAVEPLYSLPDLPATKLSAAILEFAKPLLDEYPDDPDYKAAIELAIVCWNIAVLPEDQQERELRSLVKTVRKGLPGIELVARTLVNRKRTLFAHDRRMVMDHILVGKGKSRCLYVTSPLMLDSPTRSHEG